MSVTILLADDHIIVRQGLRALLEAQTGFSVIGEAKDGIEAIHLIERTRPDVTVLDIMMPGLNGLEVARQMHKLTRIVMLSMYDNEAYLIQALKNGAFGFVLKDATSLELVDAIRHANRSEYYLCKPFSNKSLSSYIKKGKEPEKDPLFGLTDRERQVLQLVVEGNNTHAIALKLSISPRTVEIHRQHIMQKLEIHSQSELVKFAVKRGMIEL